MAKKSKTPREASSQMNCRKSTDRFFRVFRSRKPGDEQMILQTFSRVRANDCRDVNLRFGVQAVVKTYKIVKEHEVSTPKHRKAKPA
jgi:hypothetical protein